ncbi:MAG: Ig-like domain-containing protein [Clostridia bacterium]|nr:Ig-like domain-containing protein [Clostridia bacterium]
MKKHSYSIISFLLACVLLIACLVACKGGGNNGNTESSSSASVENEENSLYFSPNTLTVEIGESAQAQLTGLAEGETVVYTSTNPTIATVDADGHVVGVAVGETLVKATTDKGDTALLAVTVYDKTLAGLPTIRVAKDNITVQVGDEYALNASLVRGDEILPGEITWESNNEEVARVENGNIVALAEGNAILTARAVYDGMTADAKISVAVSPQGFTVCPDYTNKSVYKGNVFPLTISAMDGDETITLTDVTYQSSNLDIAYLSTVDGVTTLEALKGGKVTITASFDYQNTEYTVVTDMYIYGTHTVSVYALGYTNSALDHRIRSKMYGDLITLSLDKKVAGRDIKCWYVNGEKIQGNTFLMPDENVTAYAKYVNETEGDFTVSFTQSALFGLNQATYTFHEGLLSDENGATSTDNNYVEINAVGKDGGALTFNFDQSVVVSNSASVVLRVYCQASTSLYLGINETKKALFARNVTTSSEAVNKKMDIQTNCWIEIAVPLNDFTANENVLGNFSIGIVGGKCYVDYIMLKY